MFKVFLSHWDNTGERYGEWRESLEVFYTTDSEELVRNFVTQKNKIFINKEIKKLKDRIEKNDADITHEKNQLDVLINSNVLDSFKTFGLTPEYIQNKIDFMEKAKRSLVSDLNELINDPYKITGFYAPVESKWDYEELEVRRIVEENGSLVDAPLED